MRWIANGMLLSLFISLCAGCASSGSADGTHEGSVIVNPRLSRDVEFIALLTDRSSDFTLDAVLANRAYEMQTSVDLTRLDVIAAKHAEGLTEAQRRELPKLDNAVAAIGEASAMCLKNLRNIHSAGHRAQRPVFDADTVEFHFVLDQTQGNAIRTDRPLDVMISGEGFFQVSTPDVGNGTSYTRAGKFFVNNEGRVVLGNADGPLLEPAIDVPGDATDIGISADGGVSGRLPGQTDRLDFGQIELGRFINPAGLEMVGGNLLVETDASGPPITGNADTEGLGQTLGKFLESSNVDPFHELDQIHKYQRWLRLARATVAALRLEE